jgi:hypothetical protein
MQVCRKHKAPSQTDNPAVGLMKGGMFANKKRKACQHAVSAGFAVQNTIAFQQKS